MMKRTSIIIIIVSIAVAIFCLVHFKHAPNPVDSDTMTVGSTGERTTEWPLFIGLLGTFVGVCFYFIGSAEEKKAKKR